LSTRSRFISAKERTRRIEAVMAGQSPPWTWRKLSMQMSRSRSSVVRALRVKKGYGPKLTVMMLVSCAKALGVKAGFLIDREGPWGS